jgi:aldose 1-epimerase
LSRVVIESGPARLEVDPDHGARLASLRLWGTEVLVTSHPDPMRWGCYPMAPWAGRVRRGRFTFRGEQHSLPANLGDHALHGTVYDASWRQLDSARYGIDLEAPWPFPGQVTQRIELMPESLSLELAVSAPRPMPAAAGWHPWFRRDIDGVAAELDLDAAWMELRDDEGIPSGARVLPPPGPWDDCFGGLRRPPVVRWPGHLEMTIESDCPYCVVFTEDPAAICVEPQTAPPDSLNANPFVVDEGRPLLARTRWSWRQLA